MTNQARDGAYKLGYNHAIDHADCVARYNQRPPDRCPYPPGSPQEKDYDEGWKHGIAYWNALER